MNDDFDPRTESVLRHARAHAQPDVEQLARAFDGVRSRLEQPSGSGGAPHAGTASATQRAFVSRRTGSFASRARFLGWSSLMAALGFWLGLRYERSAQPITPIEASRPASTAALGPATPEVVTRAAEPSKSASGAAPEAVPASEASLPSNPSHTRPKPTRAARSDAATRTVSEPASSLGFRQVLDLLRRAERARQGGAPEVALGLLTEIDARAVPEILRDERALTRVLALCDQGELELARRAARELRAAPGSIYTSRLEQSCVTETH
jgi:hypothetical protein